MAGATIAVASDHAGFDLKEILKGDLQAAGYAVLDLGTNSTASVDYPDYGAAMGDVGVYGQKLIKTPRIDELAAARGRLGVGNVIGLAFGLCGQHHRNWAGRTQRLADGRM